MTRHHTQGGKGPGNVAGPYVLTDPVGVDEIGRRLQVAPETPHKWRQRGILPLPLFVVSGAPVWDWPVIVAWARATGRLVRDTPVIVPAPVGPASSADRRAAAILSGGNWR